MNPNEQQAERPFLRRMELRNRMWWEEVAPESHSRDECMSRRSHLDSEASWKCCEYWQRKLYSKWNSRQFAIKLGMRVPDLYWAGEDVRALPLEALPESYVIRFCSGHSSRQVWVMDGNCELLRDRQYTTESLRQDLVATASAYPYRVFVMVEERLRRSDDRLGLCDDIKIHTFGDEIPFIITRVGMTRYGYYFPDWRPVPFPVSNKKSREIVEFAKPRYLDEMLVWARRYSNAFGSYVRVDLYDTETGPVFGELATQPCGGKCYTPQAERVLNEHWEKSFPDRI